MNSYLLAVIIGVSAGVAAFCVENVVITQVALNNAALGVAFRCGYLDAARSLPPGADTPPESLCARARDAARVAQGMSASRAPGAPGTPTAP